VLKPCPLCSKSLQDSLFDFRSLPSRAFSSRAGFEGRALFEFCGEHGVFYSQAPVDSANLEMSYGEAPFDSHAESLCAAKDYYEALKPYLAQYRPRRVLDVGSGDGAFLSKLDEAFIESKLGLELNGRACQWAQEKYEIELLRHRFEDFEVEKRLDLITMFHVLSHLPLPLEALDKVSQSLRSGALFCVVDHDPEGGLQRLLGKKSPIFDPTHFTLWTRDALIKELVSRGFKLLETRAFKNKYPILYWLKMLGLDSRWMSRIFAKKMLRLRAGNRIWVFEKL